MKYIILTVYAALAVYDSYASEHDGRRTTKVFLMPVLCLFAVLYSAENGTELPALLPCALLCGWTGDILLIKKTPKRISAGLGAFLAGHILYAFLLVQGVRMHAASAAVCALLCLSVFYLLHRHIICSAEHPLKEAGTLYMAVLVSDLWISMVRLVSMPGIPGCLVFAGSAVFTLSDTLLACQTVHKLSQKGVMQTYAAAQLLLVLGLLI